jgi:glutamate dehydrogenase (NAD(P)+)
MRSGAERSKIAVEGVWEKRRGQLICTVAADSMPMGYVVIDSVVGGRSCGGLRMLPDIDEGEMRGLARAMTLKYGFLGLPQGGAKAGVIGDPESSQKERWLRLKAFGRAIAPLLRSRAYIPGADMGTNNTDIRYMLGSVGVPVRPRELRGTDSGYYTALTVRAAAKRAAKHIGLPLSGCRVAIEGFGKVGSALAGLLAEADARVVAISTLKGGVFNPKGLDVTRLTDLAAKAGSRVVEFYPEAERMDRAALLELPVDLLCPCARHNSLHTDNAVRVKARIICPGANNPVTPEAEQLLFEQGVVCMPDFVTNCGGVLGGTMAFASVSQTRIAAFIDRHIGARVAWVLNEAARQGVLPREIAVRIAQRRFEQVQRDAEHPTALGRLFNVALELYRRGCIPGPLVASLSLPYFERSLA